MRLSNKRRSSIIYFCLDSSNIVMTDLEPSTSECLSISRPVYNQKRFDAEFSLDRRKTSKIQSYQNEASDNECNDDIDKDTGYNLAKNRKNDKKSFKLRHDLVNYFHPKKLLGMFTILNLITEYNFKENFLADFFSGITGWSSFF